MKIDIYNTEGKEVKKIDLKDELFQVAWNDDLMAQVVNAMLSNSRQPIAHTKDRSDVRGGGRKPWKQKGTGRARHGSRRSPIWRGGGITFGPRSEKDYSRKVNKKAKAKALAMLISKKITENEVFFIDSIKLDEPKTAQAKQTMVSLSKIKGLENLATRRKNSALIVLPEKDKNTEKSFANIGSILMDSIANISVLDILKYKYLVFGGAEQTIEKLEKRINVKK